MVGTNQDEESLTISSFFYAHQRLFGLLEYQSSNGKSLPSIFE